MEVFNQASLAARAALLVSAIPMILGVAFALRPNERWLSLMRPLSLAAIFAAVSNFFLGVANALQWLGSPNPGDPSALRIAAVGLSEAAVFPFASFAFLTVAWLCIAIGMRKTV
jgi:hypothetical protein